MIFAAHGAPVEVRDDTCDWIPVAVSPSWNWQDCNYRISPEWLNVPDGYEIVPLGEAVRGDCRILRVYDDERDWEPYGGSSNNNPLNCVARPVAKPDPIQTWLDSLPARGDQSLVGVPPDALRKLIEERDKWRREHRAMSKGAQTNAEVAKGLAEKIADLRDELRQARGAAGSPDMEEVEPQALQLMEAQGGSFARALARAYVSADQENRSRLRKAFRDMWQRYRDWASKREGGQHE